MAGTWPPVLRAARRRRRRRRRLPASARPPPPQVGPRPARGPGAGRRRGAGGRVAGRRAGSRGANWAFLFSPAQTSRCSRRTCRRTRTDVSAPARGGCRCRRRPAGSGREEGRAAAAWARPGPARPGGGTGSARRGPGPAGVAVLREHCASWRTRGAPLPLGGSGAPWSASARALPQRPPRSHLLGARGRPAVRFGRRN